MLWLLPVLSSPPFCSPFWYAPRRYVPRRARLLRCPVPVLPPAHGEAAACRLRAGKLRRPVGAALPVPAAVGFGLCKVRVPYPLADTFLFPGSGVYLDSPLAGHFLRDFFTRLILFYVSVPPIRALARAQYSAFISMLYNACQAALRLPPSCRCRKRGQAQRRLSDSPP